jgi:NADPH-dependent 2,4-dienoyl-CoA reductase/sulfur reductase-like enzyme
LPTVDPELGALVRAELQRHGVEVLTNTRVDSIAAAPPGSEGSLEVSAAGPDGQSASYPADVVLISVGVRPDTSLGVAAGTNLGVKGAISVDRQMRTNLPDVFAAGDCVTTQHRLLGTNYLPLGTTAHKQGRVAGENALGASREFAGSLGTQVVKIFGLVTARTGLRDHEATAAGLDPVTVTTVADDHKVYYPGSQPITISYTGDRTTGRLLGVQLIGRLGSEIAKRIDIPATAIFNELSVDAISDLDLAYTPPLGSPWDAIQAGAQAWVRHTGRLADARHRGVG